MTDLFLKLLDMSLSASWVILAVIAARLVLKRAPKWMNCALWALVAVRLLCPITLESGLSLVPKTDPIPEEIQTIIEDPEPGEIITAYGEPSYVEEDGQAETGKSYLYMAVPAYDGSAKAVGPVSRENNLGFWLNAAPLLWLCGMLAMFTYALLSYHRVAKKVTASIDLGNGVYICDYIDTPFILGIGKPRIYLSSAMHPEDAEYVLAHERAHLKRKDHWWKPLGFALLSIHWFNPLMWVAYILLCQDIELACDERVVKDMGTQEKKAYSEALLKCSVPRHLIMACPLAFGEVGVKERVKSVLNYRKPGFWIVVASIAIIIVVAVCFLTDPVPAALESPFEKDLWVTEAVYSEEGSSLKDVPSKLLDTVNLSKAAASTIATYYWDAFEEITLTESNFDAYLSEKGTWTGSSAQTLRRQNVNAWVLHATDFGNKNYHDFFYLLQQKNGDLYLTYGTCWTAKLKPGKTYISWICKLEDARTDRPLAGIDTPFLYTRMLKSDYLYDANGLMVTAYASDGSQTDYKISSDLFMDLLHSIPEDAFSLGTPIQDVETSVSMDLSGSDYMDVTLRYGEGKVDMVFHWNAPWEFADTGDSAWVIQCDDLNAFFHPYSRNDILPSSLLEPQDAYQWCQDTDISYMDMGRVFVFSSQQLNGAYNLGTGQLRELLSQLKEINSSAFIPGELDLNDQDFYRDGGIISLWLNDPADRNSHIIEIAYDNNRAYFVIDSLDGSEQHVWEIRDEDFTAYQATLYDLTGPYDRTIEYPTGTLSVSHGYASITMDTYDFLEYEAVDYVDEETPFGIRYRPKAVDEGWVFLASYPGGYTPDPFWELTGNGTQGSDHPRTFFIYSELIDGSNYPRAQHYTNLPGDYVILYENTDAWLDEYESEIDYPSSWGNINIASDYLTSDEIMDIAYDQLETLCIEADGESQQLYPTFDYLTGIWTIATVAEDGQESVTAMQLDVYGNIIS